MEKVASRQKDFRYERKFLIPLSHSKTLERILISSKFQLKKLYDERTIHNVYLDTEDFELFRHNIDGLQNRYKFRIRWYGELNNDSDINLEIKIKNGNVGSKLIYKISCDPSHLSNLNITKLRNVFKSSRLPKQVLNTLLILRPTIKNSYNRNYFTTSDYKFRVTLDNNLRYQPISNLTGRIFNNNFNIQDHNIVMEVKYDIENDNLLELLTQNIPFRLSKNSKYVNGVIASAGY